MSFAGGDCTHVRRAEAHDPFHGRPLKVLVMFRQQTKLHWSAGRPGEEQRWKNAFTWTFFPIWKAVHWLGHQRNGRSDQETSGGQAQGHKLWGCYEKVHQRSSNFQGSCSGEPLISIFAIPHLLAVLNFIKWPQRWCKWLLTFWRE